MIAFDANATIFRQVVTLLAAICSLLAAEAGPLWASERAIRFVPTNQFDSTLATALRSSSSQVNVAIIPPSLNHIPPRLKAWLDRINESGGEIRWRDETPPSRALWGVVVGAIVGILAQEGWDWLKRQMADPAENFNAVIVVESDGKNRVLVTGIEFYRRGSGVWFDAVLASKATR